MDISGNTVLERLYSDENQLTDLHLGTNTSLIELLVHDNLLSGVIPEIWNLTNLTRLKLGQNQLSGWIPESICDLDIDFLDIF